MLITRPSSASFTQNARRRADILGAPIRGRQGFCRLVRFAPQEILAFVFELFRLDFVDLHVAHVNHEVARAELQQQRIEFFSGLKNIPDFRRARIDLQDRVGNRFPDNFLFVGGAGNSCGSAATQRQRSADLRKSSHFARLRRFVRKRSRQPQGQLTGNWRDFTTTYLFLRANSIRSTSNCTSFSQYLQTSSLRPSRHHWTMSRPFPVF